MVNININLFEEEPYSPGIVVVLIISIVLACFGLSVYVPIALGVALAGLIWFYRAPIINIPKYALQSNELYSPAYGTIESISEVDGLYKVSIFLSVFDIHIQYFPVSGEVIDQTHSPYWVSTTIRNLLPQDKLVTVTQRIGYVARRISTPNCIGKHVHAGERLGMIKFGSHVDLVFSKSYRLMVKVGDYVHGPNTLIAKQ